LSQTGGQYSTWEFPVWKFVKIIFATLGLGIFIGVTLTVIGYQTDWYWRMLGNIGQVFIVQWWLGPTLAGILAIVIYVNRPKKKKEETKQNEQQK